MVDPDLGTWTYPSYDALGNLLSQTDAGSCTTTLSYDSLNRLTGCNTPAVTYTYDSLLRSDAFDGASLPAGWTTNGGDRCNEGNWLGDLGVAYADLGETLKAIEYYEQALAINRAIGNRRGEGADLGNLGVAYMALGETRNAIGYHEQTLAIARAIGDRRVEGLLAWNLGLAYAQQGDFQKAAKLLQVQVDYEREIGHPDAEKYAKWLEQVMARGAAVSFIRIFIRLPCILPESLRHFLLREHGPPVRSIREARAVGGLAVNG